MARIFILPMQAVEATIKINKEVVSVMSQGQFTFVVACLIISAVCCFASAVINLIKSRQLANHIASMAGSDA